ncbi:MAG: alpha-N-arabinofuranosidase [Spirochaetaceae bacterium]|nr:MAG: alpha-N-arabinofuranosidase [Spirochaetaceae bacterium]
MNRIVLNVDAASTRISRHVYGHFAEHLGRCIYDGFWVGTDSPIPNTRGIRNDLVDALRAIDIPNLRWPGGCFADDYHWRDGVGPQAQRASMVNAHWGGVTEDNSFGTHEFMDLCELLACEPYVCGNVGSGTVREMSDWVQYMTASASCPMSDLRAANGRPDPWKVRYWGVGNETWGCGGNMRVEYYADVYRRYATYLRNQPDNRLYRIAVGANSDDYHWTDVMMRDAGPMMDGLSLHYYTVTGSWSKKGSATEFSADEWMTCMRKAYRIEELVTRHATIMDRYDPDKRVGLIVDEWGTWHDVEPGTNPGFLYQQNTLRDALVAGLSLNSFNTHADRVHMANIAQTINVLQAMALTSAERLVLTPTYHVFEMYKGHQNASLIPLVLDIEQIEFDGAQIPRVSASASVSDAGRVLVTLCNLDPSAPTTLTCELRGVRATSVTGRVLTAPETNAHNTFDDPDRVTPQPFDGAEIDGATLIVRMPAKSVVVLQVE